MTTPLNGTVIVTTPGGPGSQVVGGQGNVIVTPALQGPPGPQGPPGISGDWTQLSNKPAVIAAGADQAAARSAIGAPSTSDVAAKQPNVTWQSTQTAAFTAAVNSAYPVSSASGTVAVTLPASAANAQIVVKKTGSDTNTVTVTGTINGTANTTVTLRLQNESKVFIGDGTGWNIYAGDLSYSALKADLNGAYAPLQPVPRISAAPVAVRSDVQVMDAPSSAPNGWASIPWNDTSGKFTIRGGTLTNSPDYGAGAGVNLINGGGTGTAFTLDTWLTGTSFAVQMVTQPDAGDYAVFVDGQPVTESVYQTITGIRLVTITMPSFGVRRVSLRLCGAIANIFVAPDSYLSATAHKSARVALLGDSWGQGWTDGSIIYAGSVGGELARQASWDVWNLCQGGTGYSYPGSGQASAYGSTARLNALAAIPQMDAIVVIGGGNDALNNVSAATVQAAATALYAAIATARPGVPVIVVGAQVGGILEGSAASFDAVNNAIKTAAQAAPNVALFVDMRAGKWITGTGGTQQVKGDGSADVLMNGIHLTRLGSRYVASRIVGAITAGKFQELASPSPAPTAPKTYVDSSDAQTLTTATGRAVAFSIALGG